MRGSYRSGTCQATGSVTAALRGQPERPNPVKLESLAAMMRAAAAIQARPNLLYAAAVMRHAARKNVVSSRTDSE
jgi:hypothetical protein